MPTVRLAKLLRMLRISAVNDGHTEDSQRNGVKPRPLPLAAVTASKTSSSQRLRQLAPERAYSST